MFDLNNRIWISASIRLCKANCMRNEKRADDCICRQDLFHVRPKRKLYLNIKSAGYLSVEGNNHKKNQ
jgi:hypothetical protein